MLEKMENGEALEDPNTILLYAFKVLERAAREKVR
jgi:hypothetical protein